MTAIKPKICSMAFKSQSYPEDMPPHFVREWRKFRGLTQEKLAEKTPFTTGAISQLETGRTHYTQKILEALADALECQPGELLLRDPTAPQNDLWTLLETAPAEIKSLFTRLAVAPEMAQRQIIGYAAGLLDRYDGTRDTAATPNA